ncbi:MAG: hypothetical protein ACFFG0_05175 [Candidatus Thorarchaeota archaeon]
MGLHLKQKKNNNMILPENGSVVIIDDRPEEALPIIKSLSKKGISTTYYPGNDKNLLPSAPTQTIRLVFLDLQLIETADEHQIAKNVVNILEQLISKENGPYILVVWSKNRAKYESRVKEEIKNKKEIAPVCIIGFNKRDCLEEETSFLVDSNDVIENLLGSLEGRLDDDDENIIKEATEKTLSNYYKTEFNAKSDAIEIIENHIRTELEKAGVFHLFVIWENLIKKSATKAVQSISSTIENGDLWEPNMRDVIKRMAKARLGKNEVTGAPALKSSLSTLTSSFSEELETEIREYEYPEYVNLDSSFLIAAQINTDTLKITSFQDNSIEKIKLLKNDIEVKGKEDVKLIKINTLHNGLSEPDKTVVEHLTKTYLSIPYQINTNLHVELNPGNEHIPGNVYKINVSDKKKEEYLETYFDKIKGDVANYHFIELEVSPICDYAQIKWKKSRLISGIIYSEDNSVKSSNKNLYPVQPKIILEDKPYKMAFDFHLFKSESISTVEQRDVWFRLKRELLLDIIANLSGHVNRPGVLFVE